MKKKVIVIGLDGLDPSIVESMERRGELPHLAKIQEHGFYSRLKTTCPAMTPVAWSTFATGTNPGGHGIFDFIRRDPETYQPDYSLSRFEQPKNIFVRPRVVNRRRGVPLWQLLTESGIPSVILRCPCTFPSEPILGRMLAGVGVPDLRGTQGKGTFYTQAKQSSAKEIGQVVYLDSGPQFDTHAIGPRNGKANDPGNFTCKISVQVDHSAGKLILHISKPPRTLEIPVGTWSPWVRLQFRLSAIQAVSGMVRFYVRQVAPHVEFYASAVNFDPDTPLFPISFPNGYAKELAEEIGPYSTLGMAEDHSGLEEGYFNEAAFLEQCDLVLAEREKMAFFELHRLTEGLLFVLFDTPDRIQHMLWRFRDQEHPFFDRDRSAEFGGMIEEQYRRYDAIVGRVMQTADENTLVIVLSDHGFGNFRRVFHVNTWLLENGFLALQSKGERDENGVDAFRGVDWSKTYAYALGLGGIYLNIKGRERQGIVEPNGEADRICRTIQKGMAGLADPGSSHVAIRRVFRREEIYSGAYASESPDLLLGCSPGFRVSWQSATGGLPREIFEDNMRRWSGDHIINPEEVPGILFMNRPSLQQEANMLDLAPTILNYLGVARHDSMEGRTLL